MEDVDASAGAVEHEDAAAGTDGNRVHAIELPGTAAVTAEFADVFHVAVEDHHAVVIETVGDEYAAVGEECDVLRFAEVSAVRALHALFAEGLEQLAAVVREDVDDAVAFVDHPDAMLRIIGADAQAVRSGAGGIGEEVIPLRPVFADFAVGVECVEEVFLHDAAVGGGEDIHAEGAGETGVVGGEGVGKAGFAALGYEDAVGRFGEDAGVAAEGEAWFGEGLVPVADDVVGAGTDRA